MAARSDNHFDNFDVLEMLQMLQFGNMLDRMGVLDSQCCSIHILNDHKNQKGNRSIKEQKKHPPSFARARKRGGFVFLIIY